MIALMPRNLSSASSAIKGGVFSTLAPRMASFKGEIYPLHVGDTWVEPPVGCRYQDLEAPISGPANLHCYASPSGYTPLVEALAAQTKAQTGVAVSAENVQITAGATGGLACVAGALLDPGDEVMILAPYWPLIAGITSALRGVPVGRALLRRRAGRARHLEKPPRLLPHEEDPRALCFLTQQSHRTHHSGRGA